MGDIALLDVLLELEEDGVELNDVDDSLELEDDSVDLEDNRVELDDVKDSLKLEDDGVDLEDNRVELDDVKGSLKLEEDSVELDSVELEEDSVDLEENNVELEESGVVLEEGDVELEEDIVELDDVEGNPRLEVVDRDVDLEGSVEVEDIWVTNMGISPNGVNTFPKQVSVFENSIRVPRQSPHIVYRGSEPSVQVTLPVALFPKLTWQRSLPQGGDGSTVGIT